MDLEKLERERKRRYRRLRELRPDLYERAVQIGSIVSVLVANIGALPLAAKVEQECVDAFLIVLEENGGEEPDGE